MWTSKRGRSAAGPATLLDTASRHARGARARCSGDTRRAAPPCRSRRPASARGDARVGHTRHRVCGPVAAAAPRACRAKTGPRGARRCGGPPRVPLSVFRFHDAAGCARLPTGAGPRGDARSPDAGRRSPAQDRAAMGRMEAERCARYRTPLSGVQVQRTHHNDLTR